MPGISDPGAALVRACLDADLAVEVVPGPDAVTTALVLSGLPADRFTFLGFLPRKGRARRALLGDVAGATVTTVLFESPRRVAATLSELLERCGPDRKVALARELTKLHEEVRRGRLGDVVAALGDDALRGECVIVVDRAPVASGDVARADVDDALRDELGSGASTRDAVATVSERLGVAKRTVYARAVELNRR